MSDSTQNSVSFPANSRDKRPLPEIIASNYGFPLAYHDVDGVRYYAVQDWLRGVVGITDPDVISKYWVGMKRRLGNHGNETWLQFPRMPYRAGDGKTYKRDYSDAKTLYRIIQRMEPDLGLRDAILYCLAQAAILLDEIRLKEGKGIDIELIRDWPNATNDVTIRDKRQGWLYLLNAHNGQYKIGRARDLAVRIGSYATLPFNFTLEHSIPCKDSRQAEAELHKRFAAKRIKGEWFRLSGPEVQEIKSITCL